MAYVDLTTVAAVLAQIDTAEPPTSDSALIQTTITGYSQYVLTRLGRQYLGGLKTYSERYDGNGSQRLQVRNYPVQSVTSLTIGTTSVLQSPDYHQAGWVIDTSGSQMGVVLVGGDSYGDGWMAGGPIRRGGGYRFWEGLQNVAITYTAGYLLEQFNEPQTVPSAAPYTVKASQSSWYADVAATDANGNAIAYTVASGIYTFPASLAGQQVMLSYQYGGVPADLGQAVTEIVAANYKRRQWVDQASQTQPGVGTVAYRSWEMSPQNQAVLDRYRNRALL